jgi:hypothetical protein
MRVHGSDILFAVEAARDAGLVGHHKDEIAPLVEQLYRLARAVDPAKARDMSDIALIVIEDAIAVEKGGRAGRAGRAS